MLPVDLNEVRYKIFQSIRKTCTGFGEVRSVTIIFESSPTAVVEMSTMEQAEAVASTFGGGLIGDSVFVDLAQGSDMQ
jgi:hypothetical protein